MWAIFGKCSLRLELAGRQFVTRARATPDRLSKSSSKIHLVRKFMPERIDPQSPREDKIPHPRKEITTTFAVIFFDIFTILSLSIHRSELSQARACLHSATEGPGRLPTAIIRLGG